MDEESLKQLYSTFTDEALVAAAAAGPDSYHPEAWRVIQELLVARGCSKSPGPPESGSLDEPPKALSEQLLTTRGSSLSEPVRDAPPAAIEQGTSTEVSRFFIWSRFVQGKRWPQDQVLPLNGRDFLAVVALLFGLSAVLSLVLRAVVDGPPPADVNPPIFALMTVLALSFGVSANRLPSPRTWTLAMLYAGLSPFLVVLLIPAATPFTPLQACSSLSNALAWLLYFARRRSNYGLPAWPPVL
jgi:hypothetical protein